MRRVNLVFVLLVLGAMMGAASAASTNEWYDKGLTLAKAGDYFGANVALSQATYEDPSEAREWYLYGVLLNALGRYSEARDALHMGIQLQPEYGKPWFWNTATPGPLGTMDDAKSIFSTGRLGELVF
jgi:tetratricopeptide (TPR) repeat protein